MKHTITVLFACALLAACTVQSPTPGTSGTTTSSNITPTSMTGAQVCQPGAPCNFSCPSGSCEYMCTTNSNCTGDCAGGGCRMSCATGATCKFGCAGGNCTVACAQGAACDTSCMGGNCRSQ